jgi:RNA ligase (TIGR02306 family)
MTRKMAYVVTIDAVQSIAGADAIEVAQVGGWAVVTKKGEYAPGDRAVYFEIDAFLPEGNPGWQFLVDKASRTMDGRRGHVLRTVRLRGQVSQGLLIKPADLGLDVAAPAPGEDLAPVLGVSRYEPPVPAELSGVARGPFPGRVRRTDQERIQNLAAELAAWQAEGELWEVTEKLEGASCTFAWLDGELHVCSRNVDLEDAPGNTLWRQARALDVAARMESCFGFRNMALQGEMIGADVQGNPYRRDMPEFHLYDVYDADCASYFRPAERIALAEVFGMRHVPVIDSAFKLAPATTMAELLAQADGASTLLPAQAREGLVFKRLDGTASFKVVSNRYLLEQKD